MKLIRFLEVKSEIGAGTRGTRLGPDAIKTAALNFDSLLFKEYECVEIPHENHLLYEPSPFQYSKRIDGVLAMYKKISKEVKNSIQKRTFPIVLSGDHSSAGATIAGIKMAFPKKRLGIIWIDAHADLHSPYTTPSGNMHGMPLATVFAEDNLDNKINKPHQDTIKYWNELKTLGGISPKVNYNDIVMISVRDYEKQEAYLMKHNNIRNFTTAELRKKGAEKTASEANALLSDCDHIYITFDVDSMDPSVSKGTGTPAPKGITEKEAGKLLSSLVQNEKICCLEITEVNPTFDKENLMAEIAFEILQKVVGYITK